ncbi:MAG TPA: iron donor protein CyaY [Polyangia bacterium]|nr:iron donor protein CyaY [Polyangia bacterium]
MLDEKIYRRVLDETYDRIDGAFEDVDPDLAEVTVAQGALTIVFQERTRLMLTPQPSPRQLWVAYRDRAWHFDWDAARGAWMDDRGQGLELLRLVEDTTREAVGVSVSIAAAKGPLS